MLSFPSSSSSSVSWSAAEQDGYDPFSSAGEDPENGDVELKILCLTAISSAGSGERTSEATDKLICQRECQISNISNNKLGSMWLFSIPETDQICFWMELTTCCLRSLQLTHSIYKKELYSFPRLQISRFVCPKAKYIQLTLTYDKENIIWHIIREKLDCTFSWSWH